MKKDKGIKINNRGVNNFNPSLVIRILNYNNLINLQEVRL